MKNLSNINYKCFKVVTRVSIYLSISRFRRYFFLGCHLSIKIKLNFYSKYYHYMFKNSKGNAFLRPCSLSNGVH